MTPHSPVEAMVAEIGEKLGVELRSEEGYIQIPLENHALTPVLVEEDQEHLAVSFRFRTTSSDFPGERTDLHDVLPLAIAALARATGVASCSMIDEGNPAVPLQGEIYGRYILPEQPVGHLYSREQIDQLITVLAAMWWGEKVAWRALCEEGETSADGSGSGPASGWMNEVRKSVRQVAGDALEYERTNPTWNYFHAPRSGMTVIHCDQFVKLLRVAASGSRDERWDGPEGTFTKRGELHNRTPAAVVERGTRILRKLEPQLRREAQAPLLIPLEDRVVLAGQSCVVCLRAECGRRAFAQARETALERRQSEASFLFSSKEFQWAETVPADRFESLIRELLAASREILRVRSAGPTNDRDRGRDLIAEWLLTAPAGVVAPGQLPTSVIEVVVQCKARKGTVGKAQVRDVRDTVERHEAGGYFLAVSTEISGDLVDYLSGLRSRLAFVDWWTRAEIEDELRRNPEIADRYDDVVAAVEPGTA